MKLYHGSSVVVQTPDVDHSREKIDFGRGFYVTPNLQLCFKNNRVIRNTLFYSESIEL